MPSDRIIPRELPFFVEGGVSVLMERVTEAYKSYETLWESAQWQELLLKSVELAGLGELVYNQVVYRSTLIPTIRKNLAKRDKAFREVFMTLGQDSSSEAEDARTVMREQLVQGLGDADEADAVMTQLVNGEGVFFETARDYTEAQEDHIDLLTPAFVMLRSLAGSATYIGNLQEAHQQIQSTPHGSFGPEALSLLSETANGLQGLAEGGFSQLYDALKTEVDLDNFVALASFLHVQASSSLGLAGRLLGRYLSQTPSTANGVDRKAQLRAALRVSEWVGRVSLLQAYTAYVQIQAATHHARRWYGYEKRRLNNRSLLSEAPQGVPVSIDQLIQDTNLQVGHMFQVEGIVAGIVVDDDPVPPKFSTFFHLTDPVTDISVRVRAHMFSLINNGLSNGAYCRVNGFLRQGARWLDLSVGLDIDRVSLTQLRRTSWTDDVTYRMKGVSTLYPDEMNMYFTPNLL